MAIKHVKLKRKIGLGVRGIYHFTLANAEHPTAKRLRARIVELIAYQKKNGILLPETGRLIQELNRLFATQRFVYHNLIPDVALAAIMNNIGDASASPTAILATGFGVGTGTTAPAAGDTALETPTYDNVIASRTSGANKAFLSGFIDATEDNAFTPITYREAGVFSDDVLLSRVAINIAKTNTKTLTVDWEMTLTYVP